jgi:putative peptide zinc metalloprotease protein
MRESAFVDPPWLLEREGEGYVQVTELLYRIAEAMDGQRTLEQIAEHVSNATGRAVTRDNVRQLVATQFVAKGLVPTADGQVKAGNKPKDRSLLQLGMRVRAVEAKRIDPLVRAVGWLFWPPILAVVVLVGVAAQAWLYFVHGVAGSVHDALYAPGLLVLCLAATILAAGFHELGHAAALRYGGGQPGAIGAGVYVVYPAFYTEVTDNYRLGRWGRVRTDLGGFYFNLLFALGVMALYAATGQEALLLVVSLLNLEVLRQIVPTMRLDGYWVLVDLTGVPDFLSHIGGFVRSVVPWSNATDTKAKRLPELKAWATWVFAAYILIAVPLLIVQMLMLLRGMPRVLATAWDSGGQQLAAIGAAMASGETGAALSSVGQLLALALPTAAVLFAIVRFGRRIVVGLWRWSTRGPVHAIAGALVGLGITGLLAYNLLPAPEPGQTGALGLPFYGQARYSPIQPNERGTVTDMVAGVVVTMTPADEPAPAAEPTSEPSPEPSPEPTAEPTVEPTSIATPTPATPQATPQAVSTAPATLPPARKPAPAIAVSPAPTATPTATPVRTPTPQGG